MKRQGSYRTTVAWLGTVVGILMGSAAAKAEIIMSEPTNVGPVINDGRDVQECDFSHDGLELYYAANNRPGGYGGYDLWVSKRETPKSPWQEPINLGPNINSSGREIEPSISGDGLELYFGLWDDFYTRVCRRASKDAPWGSPTTLIELGEAWRPDISFDGLTLYVESDRGGGRGGEDIWVATRATKDDPWSELVNLGPNVNSTGPDYCPCISTDNLTLVFMRGYTSMWATTRKSVDDEWEPPVELISRSNFNGPALSPDGSTLYFDANTQYWGGYGGGDILQVKFIPSVDFNSDEIVDIDDLVILIEHWGQEDLSCDIGPLPLGDGIVDQADLKVLMDHWGREPYDPALIAHWKMDESEGHIACDSALGCDGTLSGNPVWEPAGGRIEGALHFDGLDDYVGTPFVVNPAEGPFSVFAWVKGRAPGQVILSQTGGANWLIAAAPDGALMTELTSGRAGPLVSAAIVTDGAWHRVGLVRDDSNRTLYVDGIEVARDTVTSLTGCNGRLHLGAGKDLAPGTFWQGLIDDVRIYNRAVKP